MNWDDLLYAADSALSEAASRRLIGCYTELIVTSVDLQTIQEKLTPVTNPERYIEIILQTTKDLVHESHSEHMSFIQKALCDYYAEEVRALQELTSALNK